MNRALSKSEANRQSGAHQVDEQHAHIVDVAEKLFLQNGLENTTMKDIAAQAGITKVTLYRYFPSRDIIALEIQERMMQKIMALLGPEAQEVSLETTKKLARVMIRNFDALRDAFRFMGMFDKRYLDNPPNTALTQWTKAQLISLPRNGPALAKIAREHPQGNHIIMITSTVIWFLEKLALRGELTWSDPTAPLTEHLKLFEEMIVGYIDRCANTQPFNT